MNGISFISSTNFFHFNISLKIKMVSSVGVITKLRWSWFVVPLATNQHGGSTGPSLVLLLWDGQDPLSTSTWWMEQPCLAQSWWRSLMAHMECRPDSLKKESPRKWRTTTHRWYLSNSADLAYHLLPGAALLSPSLHFLLLPLLLLVSTSKALRPHVKYPLAAGHTLLSHFIFSLSSFCFKPGLL